MPEQRLQAEVRKEPELQPGAAEAQELHAPREQDVPHAPGELRMQGAPDAHGE